MRLTKEQLFEAAKIVTEKVSMPEWGKDAYVLVRSLTAGEKNTWQKSRTLVRKRGRTETNWSRFTASLVALCVCDENGERIYTDEDVIALDNLRAGVVERIYEVAAKLNGVDDEEEAFFASNGTGNSGSNSPSPSPSASPTTN